jgi:hypothetical protein
VLKDAPPVVATAQEEDNDEAFSMEFWNILKEVEQLGVWLAGWPASVVVPIHPTCLLYFRAGSQHAGL